MIEPRRRCGEKDDATTQKIAIMAIGPMTQASKKQQWAELADLLRDLLDGRIGLTEGCRRVVTGYYYLERGNKLFDPFRGFDSESDAFPLGEGRELWAPDSLRAIDGQRELTEAHYRTWLLDAAKHLRKYAQERCV